MLGLAFGLIIVGYALQYTAVSNFRNGGNGPSFFESLGVKTKLSGPSPTSGGSSAGVGPIFTPSGTQIGQPPTTNESPVNIVNV